MNAFERYQADIREADDEERQQMLAPLLGMGVMLCFLGFLGYLAHMDGAGVSGIITLTKQGQDVGKQTLP